MFRIHMLPTAPRDYRQAYPDRDTSARHKIFFDELLDQGILLIYSGTGAISTPMGDPEIDQLINAVDVAFAAAEMRRTRV